MSNNEACLRIKLRMIENLLDDPSYEFSSTDMEYYDSVHERLRNRLLAATPVANDQRLTVQSGSNTLMFGENLEKAIEAAVLKKYGSGEKR